MENHQSFSVILTTRPKKTDVFAATTRPKEPVLLEGMLHQICT
jgi:hypothetical protein